MENYENRDGCPQKAAEGKGSVLVLGGFYKFISDDFAICFEQIAVRNEGAMRAL